MEPHEIRYLVVHCSATRSHQTIDITDIDRWHRERGWNGCGYHYVITRDGRIQGGRSLNQIGAHTKGHNRLSWGICMVGGLGADGKGENNFTPAQLSALRALLSSLHAIAPQAEILGHRDLSPDVNGDGVIDQWEWVKECPSFDVRAWMNGRMNQEDL